MKIALPELPPCDIGLVGQVKFAHSPEAIRQYARQAIREYVEGLEATAWMTHHDEPMLFPTEQEAACYCDDDEHPIPLIIKPELDDADE